MMAEPGRRRNVLALLASLLVHVIPLPGPHAVPLLGTVFVGAVSGAGPNRALAFGMVVLALAAQALTFLVVRWILSGRRRWVTLVPFVPALVLGVYVLAMLVVPRWALIERDTAPENLSWPIACAVPHASVHAVRSPAGATLAGAGNAWLRIGPDGSRFGLLRPGCVVEPMADPPPRGTMHAIVHAVPSGATLETTWDVPTQRQLSWWRASPDAAPIELPPMPDRLDAVPILSDDGAWLVLIERPDPPPASPSVVLRRIRDGASRTVGLEDLERGTFVALGATLGADAAGDIESATIALCRNEDEFVSIGLDGRTVDSPFRPPGVDPGALSFRRIEGGWAAWDSYVEDRPYAIAWETGIGRGTHVVPKGRGINSVDIDPGGRWIALSTGPVYSLGGVHDDVIVISAKDGVEVFRDALPAHARSDVAFLGADLLAYTAWDGGLESEVRVVRAP